MPNCIKCQLLTTATKRCPYCRACYCSKACRSTDWSRHKSECISAERVSPSSNSSNVAASITSSETEELAGPRTHKRLHCEGHPCATCGKCRDWQFHGNVETWRWIQNYKNWNQDDKNRWVSLYPLDFRKRTDATCDYQFSSPHYFHYLCLYGAGKLGGPLSHIPGPFFDPPPGCLCDSNREN